MQNVFQYIQSDYYRYTGKIGGGLGLLPTYYSNETTVSITVSGYDYRLIKHSYTR